MKTNIKIIIGVVVAVLISVSSCYVLANSIMNSKDVYYKDNSGLLANNVQDAIDGTCTKFEEKVDNFLDKIYPVGSIYITTTLSTTSQVKEALGGEWEVYGDGKTLLSSTGESEKTGGANTVTLTTDNLPSHNHSFTPAGSVSSSFTGTAVTSTANNVGHTHNYSKANTPTGGTAITIAQMPAHNHISNNGTIPYWGGPNQGGNIYFQPASGTTWGRGPIGNLITSQGSGQAHTHTIGFTSTATGGVSANHTHNVTAAGTVSSSFTGTASNTGSTGGGKSFSVQDAYITVYMYKRTK